MLAERYLIDVLTDGGKETLPTINGNQTGKLIEMYKNKFADKWQTISTLNKVLLMSSENIHINSFMFEPLIDMSIISLINLYGEVSILA